MVVIRGNGNIVAGGNIVINGKRSVVLNGEDGVIGSGKVKAERRQVDRVDSIVLDGSISLVFSPGGSQFVRVTADENILPLVTTQVSGTTLHIECSGSFSTTNEITVEVEMPSLMKLTTRGSGNAEIEKIDQPSMHVELIGSGEIEIAGKVDSFTVELNGSGDIDASTLVAKSVVLSLNGSGDIRAQATESVRARLSGSGDIKVSGNPPKQDCVANGSGDIRIR